MHEAIFKNFILQLFANFFFFTHNFLQQFSLRMAQNVSKVVWFKKYAIKLFQYSSIVFDLHNKELCDGLTAS